MKFKSLSHQQVCRPSLFKLLITGIPTANNNNFPFWWHHHDCEVGNLLKMAVVKFWKQHGWLWGYSDLLVNWFLSTLFKSTTLAVTPADRHLKTSITLKTGFVNSARAHAAAEAAVGVWRTGGGPQVTEGENAAFATPTLQLCRQASAAGACILKKVETAASASSCTYTHVYLPLNSAGCWLEQCREVRAEGLRQISWRMTRIDWRKRAWKEDKSSTQSICTESHSGGNMMRDTDLRCYIHNRPAHSPHMQRPTGPRPLVKLLCCAV